MSVAVNEADRLAEASGDRYNRVVRLAQAIFGAPIAALNLIGETHQHTVAAVGAPTTSSPLADSICRHTVEYDDVFEVFDLREDQRFQDNKIVAGPPRVRFYAGVPLQSTSGHKVGALCILDLVPRELGSTQREMLADLGAMLERELAVEEEMIRAGEVQRLLLPSRAPGLPGIDVAGRVRQAREAGGDFFDWHLVATPASPDQLQLVIADVMGKGLSASLIASEMRAVLRTHSRYVPLGQAIQRTADTTVHDLENSGSFVTMWAGRLDPETGTLRYVDAGHGLGVLVTANGIRRLTQEHLPLGLPVASTWTEATETMRPGDVLVVVSDGVFDVFGDVDAALAAVQRVAETGVRSIEIVNRIIDYAAAQGATDDLTAVVVRRTEARR
jgi:serine phosphatase RsbU (regulator of sigma subunit)